MVNAACSVFIRNDRDGYMIPMDDLYPFQWNCDSAFVSMRFATFDINRSYQELERLVEGQWDDGMLPHTIFHMPSQSYFPGLDVWNTDHCHSKGPQTSGITQLHVFGIALRFIYQVALTVGRDDMLVRTCLLFKATLYSHRWWLRARVPEKHDLVAILHP